MNKNLDKHYENISKLYLRLKGYVVTNLILHSEKSGNLKTELDILGIRMPFHLQENRQVNLFDYLESSKENIEIIIVNDGSPDNSLKICKKYAKKELYGYILAREECGTNLEKCT